MGQITKHSPEQTTYVEVQSHPEPTALDWFREFNAFWVAGILPIALAYIGWKSLKAKQERTNAERLDRYRKEGREDEYSDKTKLNMIFDALHKDKD
jgi:hypothetical protein